MTDTVVTPAPEIGSLYYSREHRMTCVVLGPATVWEFAPDQAIRVRWSNGNITTTRPDDLVPADT